MKKDLKKLVFLLFIFFFLGLFLSWAIFQRIKSEFILNNEILVSDILEKYPELEHDIVKILSDPHGSENGTKVLKKYGLSSLESLDYLKSFQNFHNTVHKRI